MRPTASTTIADEPIATGSSSIAKARPIERWIRLVSATCTKKPPIETHAVTSARNAVMLSASPPVASAAMLSCCCTIAAPAAAQPITSAMIFRWSRFGEQTERLASADALLVDIAVAGQRRLTAEDRIDDEDAQAEHRSADEQHVVAADLVDQHAQDRRAHGAAQARAAADEAEESLGLPRVVDLVGQRPELADEEQAKQQAERVQSRP